MTVPIRSDFRNQDVESITERTIFYTQSTTITTTTTTTTTIITTTTTTTATKNIVVQAPRSCILNSDSYLKATGVKRLKVKKPFWKKKPVTPQLPKNALCLLNEMFRGLIFETVSQEGPVHAPIFTISVSVNDKVFEGKGKSKKLAKHNAAEAALRSLINGGESPPNDFKIYTTSEATTDFTSDISDVDVNSFEASRTASSPSPNGNENGLADVCIVGVSKPPVRAIEKSPVMLLNELHPDVKYTVISESGMEQVRYTTEAIVKDQRFEGTGPSKKLSKAAAARSALAALHNISYGPVEVGIPNMVLQGLCSEIPQVFADHVASLICRKFMALMETNLNYAKRKVLAGVVLSRGYDKNTCKIITLSTGTKCINGEYMSTYGTVVNDSHAEIVSRRGVIRFLYKELSKHINAMNCSDSILEHIPGSSGFRVKENYLLHLYINTAPCGDSRIFSPHDEQLVDKHPNRKARGQLRTKIECGEGTIPAKSTKCVQTWDGILQGERLLTMSCSDKIAKWNVVGLQGALLSNFIEPVYFDSIILGSLYHPEHLGRALYGRIENSLQALPPPYRLNKPKMALISNKEERQMCKPPSFSVNWTIGDELPEVISSVTGKTEQGEISRLAKCKMFVKFINLVGKIPSFTFTGSADCSKTYKECKDKAMLYQAAKSQLNKAFEKANLGTWVSKPMEAEQFESKTDHKQSEKRSII